MPSSPERDAVDSDAETLECDTDSDAARVGGETLALDDDDDDPLNADTQVVEDWDETQVVEDWEETQVVPDFDDGTEVLSDREDDGAEALDDGNSAAVDEDPSRRNDITPASAGEERSSGPARKSFSDVRTASLRASGHAALSRTSPNCFLSKESSIDSKLSDLNVNLSIGGGNDGGLIVALNIIPSNDSDVAERCLNDVTVKLNDYRKSEREGIIPKSGHGVVRSLFQDEAHVGVDGSCMRPNSNGNEIPPGEESGYPIAGLSYVGSQEPGEMSQANAIDVVDRLLCLNELGITEEGCIRKPVDVASPPSTGVKAVEQLAKVAHRSPAGKQSIFEWDDADEDEGGGDFFVKRKISFFDNNKNMKKSKSLPPKSRCSYQKADNNSTVKGTKNEDSNLKVSSRKKGLDYSSSVQPGHISRKEGRLMLPSCGKARRKIALQDVNVSPDLAKKKLEKVTVSVDADIFQDIGPDTQIAVEAMEALISAAPEGFNPVEINLKRGATEHLLQSVGVEKEYSAFSTLRKKRSSVARTSDATIRRSKRLITSDTNSNGETELVLENDWDETLKVKKPAKKIRQRKLLKANPLSEERNETMKSGRSNNSKKRRVTVQEDAKTPCQKIDVNLSPISHRTRQSSANKSEKLVSLDDIHVRRVFGANRSTTVGTRRADLKFAESAVDLSRDGTCSDTFQKQEAGSAIAAVPYHPKRRRTRLTREVTSGPATSLFQNNQTLNIENNTVVVQHDNACLTRPNVVPLKTTVATTQELAEGNLGCNGSPSENHHQQRIEDVGQSSCHGNTGNHFEEAGFLKSNVQSKVKNHVSEAIYKSPVKNIIEGSPICASNVRSNTTDKGTSKSSISRELVRLVCSEGTRTPISKVSQGTEISSICVLFSRHLEEKIVNHLTKIAKRLGISIASSISDATHFITDKFVRTRNLLEAMAVGKPVVTPLWLKKCGEVSSFIVEKNYILRDMDKEKELGFSMAASLACSSQNPLLQGKRIFLTPNVKPDRKTVSSLTKAAGGQPVERIGRFAMNDGKILDELLVISCEEDYAVCIPFLEKGVKVFSSELILNGIVIQKLEYVRHQLFLDHFKQTRSTIWLKSEGCEEFHPVAKQK